MTIRVKRVYEPKADDDGLRILVDRLWPRGVSKADLDHDAWLKDVAPSTALRKWFGHDPEKWSEFRRRYAQELDHDTPAVQELRRLVRQGPATLLYAAKDEQHNHALVLRDYLSRKRGVTPAAAPENGRRA